MCGYKIVGGNLEDNNEEIFFKTKIKIYLKQEKENHADEICFPN